MPLFPPGNKLSSEGGQNAGFQLTRRRIACPRATLAASEGPAAVVGPARDGGYYLLGLRGVDPHVLPAVFAGIAWGTPTVCAELMAGLRGVEVLFEVLPFWYDIDTPEDLEALTTRRFLLSPPLPHHTLATLDELL